MIPTHPDIHKLSKVYPRTNHDKVERQMRKLCKMIDFYSQKRAEAPDGQAQYFGSLIKTLEASIKALSDNYYFRQQLAVLCGALEFKDVEKLKTKDVLLEENRLAKEQSEANDEYRADSES